jgi:hypothetical protein
MADRVLRGSRLGAVSYETDRNHDLAPRQVARYRTDNGEEFEVPFADDAETHWDMLLERRSVEELEELLKERLDIIKTRRRG